MTWWHCHAFSAPGCGSKTVCVWRRFKDIKPPKGCLRSIKTIREKASRKGTEIG